MSAKHLLPYISTPLFLINSNYDIVALRLIVGPEAVSASSGKPKDCLEQVDTCSEEEKKWMEGAASKHVPFGRPLPALLLPPQPSIPSSFQKGGHLSCGSSSPR
ncbi:hypothetical protein CLOP_g14062 [Closterium sp. NIES-67]|nr:hypothetical protein CLOP_g14062 [Closterium sp. NIES-67]